MTQSKRERDWSYKELDILRMNYGKMSDEELAKRLKRTPGAVQTRAYLLGLKKEKVTLWTPQRVKMLTDFYGIMFNKDLALWLGMSERTLKRKARELGLKKGESFYRRKSAVIRQRQSESLKKAECSSRIKKGERRSPDTEFKKGYKPSAEVIAKRRETRKRNSSQL